MPEVLPSEAVTAAASSVTAGAPDSSSLVAGWREGLAIINLRGDVDDPAFRQAVAGALGVEPPGVLITTTAAAATPAPASAAAGNDGVRLVWAGPDDWFVLGPKGQADALADRLRAALAGLHHAVTDVSSGYTVLHLSGAPARDVLSQGCPLDLHPRVFPRGACAGSLFFKASVWLWQADEPPGYELLVRRSFMGYVWLMLERASAEHGLATRRFA